MLALSRKKGEGVWLTLGDVKVHVVMLEIRGDKVRLGFEAPQQVKIFRDELQADIDAKTKSIFED